MNSATRTGFSLGPSVWVTSKNGAGSVRRIEYMGSPGIAPRKLWRISDREAACAQYSTRPGTGTSSTAAP